MDGARVVAVDVGAFAAVLHDGVDEQAGFGEGEGGDVCEFAEVEDGRGFFVAEGFGAGAGGGEGVGVGHGGEDGEVGEGRW